jgi:hypothetical protein
MRLTTTEVEIFDCSNPTGKEIFKDMIELWAESIIEHVTIDNFEILVRDSLFAFKYNEEEDMFLASPRRGGD